MAATSSSPSAEPWALPVFWAFGAGQAMIVRRLMKLGRSVTAFAAWIASQSAADVLVVPWPPLVQSTSWTCQP